jgi:hypothetical protein
MKTKSLIRSRLDDISLSLTVVQKARVFVAEMLQALNQFGKHV